MYGVKCVHPPTASGTNPITKLEQIKNDTRKVDNVLNQCDLLHSKVSQLEKQVTDQLTGHADLISKLVDPSAIENMQKRIQEVEHAVFGKEDTSLYQEDKQDGLIDTLKAITDRIDAMRDEYVDLIGSYISNGTPRIDRGKMDEYEKKLQKLEDIEKRISKLEERPKFQVTQTPLTKDNLNKIQLDKIKK